MKTFYSFVIIIIFCITSLTCCMSCTSKECSCSEIPQIAHKTYKTLKVAIYYADSAIDTLSVKCTDYGLEYGRRNGVAYLNAVGLDTMICRNCGDTIIGSRCIKSLKTNAPIKVISFE